MKYIFLPSLLCAFIINISDAVTITDGSLRPYNDATGDRTYNFPTYAGDTITYIIQSNLGTMGSGTFTINGADSDATHSTIDGANKIMFEATSGTIVNLNNLTLQHGYHGSGGGALRLANAGDQANINNVIFQNNSSDDNGGAVMVEDGGRIMFNGNVQFLNNHAERGSGGGIYIQALANVTRDMNPTFNGDATFIGNTATAMGGGLYIEAGPNRTMNLTFNGNVLFKDNKAINPNGSGETAGMSGGMMLGGKAVNLRFNMQAGTTVMFDGNEEGLVGANDIYLNTFTSAVYFSGTGGVATINGGIGDLGGYLALLNVQDPTPRDSKMYVDGNVTVNFGEKAINKNFWGDLYQSNGTINVHSDNWIHGTNFISNASTIHFFKSLAAQSFELSGGANLDLRGDQFNVLTVTNWTSDGTGNLLLSTDGVTSDVLTITDSSTGAATIHMTVLGGGAASTGADILVVNTHDIGSIGMDSIDGPDVVALAMPYGTNEATFTLAGGDTIDIGAYQYGLKQIENKDWYLTRTGEISVIAQTLKDIPALHLSVVKSGMNELRKRMGALRNNNANDELVGAWIRGYGKNMRIDDIADTRMNLFGLEGGFDIKTNAFGGKVYMGLMAGILGSEDIDVQTRQGYGAYGWTRTPSVGAYLTWMHRSNSYHKWFVDLTARHFWVRNYIELDDKSDGYDVQRGLWAFSAEVGKLFYMRAPEFMNIGTRQNSHISIEPKAELRYGYGRENNFETFKGNQGHVDPIHALSTRLYVQANFLPNGTVSTWKPFVEFGISKEWNGETEMIFAGEDMLVSDTGGVGFELVAGTNATISDRTYAYGSYTFEHGEVYTSHQLNIGIRTKF